MEPTSQTSLDSILELAGRPGSDPAQTWMSLVQEYQLGSQDFDLASKTWRQVFESWDQNLGPVPSWLPNDPLEESNLRRCLMESDCATVEQFHQWSVEHREEFWSLALEELQIQFTTDPDSIFGEANFPEAPAPLPGAQLNIVNSCFQASPDQIAMITGRTNGTLEYRTYGSLKSTANQISNYLLQQGFKPGDRIGLILPISFSSVAAYLGIVQAGLVAVSIADSFAAPEINRRLKIGETKAVMTVERLVRAGKLYPLGERIREATDLPLIFVDEDLEDWQQSLGEQSTEFEPLVGDPQNAINILFSSGTTGDPKAIPWDHTTPIKCATDAFLLHDLKPGDVCAWPTNLGWMMGPWLIFATLINRGTIAVYEDAPFGPGFGQFVQNARVNMLGLVPSMVRLWRARRSMETFDWSSIKSFSSTGEASNPDDMFYLSWLGDFKPIIEYCGGTEIGGGYISSTRLQPNAPATFSTPAFGLDIRILDEDSAETDEGELFIVPPSLGLSTRLLNRDHDQTYYSDCPKDENGNCLRRHGDYVRKLPGGYFAAGGRADDTMNLGGIKVSSVEIEKCLNQLNGISETAAVAIPADTSGPDQLALFYVLDESSGESAIPEKELLRNMNDSVRSKLNPLFKIRSIHRRDSLPRTASNKVMRRLLRDELAD